MFWPQYKENVCTNVCYFFFLCLLDETTHSMSKDHTESKATNQIKDQTNDFFWNYSKHTT